MNQISSEQPMIATNKIIYGAMTLGLATSIAFRLLVIVDHVAPDWVRPVWYFAVLGNLVFFYYRFNVTRKRKRAVRKYDLIERLKSGAPLDQAQRQALAYLLESIKRSPENINYLIISLFSVLAIIMDLVLVYYF